jgi:hypothetical protein
LPRLRPKKAQRRVWEALELDERWTFVCQFPLKEGQYNLEFDDLITLKDAPYSV